jgi:serine/threonine protein kinase
MMAILDPSVRIEFPMKGVENFDPLVVDVLKKCLVRDPSQRASIEELLNHPYLRKEGQPGIGRYRCCPSPVSEKTFSDNYLSSNV